MKVFKARNEQSMEASLKSAVSSTTNMFSETAGTVAAAPAGVGSKVPWRRYRIEYRAARCC